MRLQTHVEYTHCKYFNLFSIRIRYKKVKSDWIIFSYRTHFDMANVSVNSTILLNNEISLTIRILAGFIAVEASITILVNSIIILAFYRDKRIRSPFNLYLLNLAISDVGMAIFSMIFNALSFLHTVTPFGFHFCGFVLWSSSSCSAATSWAIMWISLDRLWSLYFPIHYREWRSKKLSSAVCICGWCFTMSWTTADVLLERLHFHGDLNYCTFNGGHYVVFKLFAQNILYNLPLVIAILSYILVVVKLSRRRHVGQQITVNSINVGKAFRICTTYYAPPSIVIIT